MASSHGDHELLLGVWVNSRDEWVLACRQERAGEGKSSVSGVRIGVELRLPRIELFPRWPKHEGADVGERHVGLSQSVDHLGISQLARRVVAVP
jgi:hypothetical protein